MSARWEIVRTDAERPWHVRWIAGNNEPVLSGQNLKSRQSAVRAIETMTGHAVTAPRNAARSVYPPPARWAACVYMRHGRFPRNHEGYVEVRDVDERAAS